MPGPILLGVGLVALFVTAFGGIEGLVAIVWATMKNLKAIPTYWLPHRIQAGTPSLGDMLNHILDNWPQDKPPLKPDD